ncbi:hypothetical protein H0H81_008266, partial [Sphagnurus paluster]
EFTRQLERNTEEVKTTFETAVAQLRNDMIEITKKANEQAQQTSYTIQETAKTIEKTATTYRDALTSKPCEVQVPFATNGNIDPSTCAREAVKMRQVLIDVDNEADKAELQKATHSELVNKANVAIQKTDPKVDERY